VCRWHIRSVLRHTLSEKDGDWISPSGGIFQLYWTEAAPRRCRTEAKKSGCGSTR
jgi:hypothetical protein